jgi:hypothetical protein
MQATPEDEILSYFQIAGTYCPNNRPRIICVALTESRHTWSTILLLGWVRVESRCPIDRLLHASQYPISDLASSVPCTIRSKSPRIVCYTLANKTQRVLADQAQKIAKGYNIPLYQSAADNLRMPYWDWAETPRLPEVVTTPNITIVVPSGQITIKNPLYEYQFLNFPLNETMFPADKDARLSTYSATVRQPTNDGLSQNSAASDDLARKPLRKNIVS